MTMFNNIETQIQTTRSTKYNANTITGSWGMSGTKQESWLGGWRSSVEGGGGPRPNYSVSMMSIITMVLMMMVMMVSWAKNCNNNQWLMIWWLNVILLSTFSEYFYLTKNLFATKECQLSRPKEGRQSREQTLPILHNDNDLHYDDQRITSPILVLMGAFMCTLVFIFVFDNVFCNRKWYQAIGEKIF